MSSSISSTRERRVRIDFRAPNFARDRDRDSDRTTSCNDAHSTHADSYGLAASIDVVRSAVRSKWPLRVRNFEKSICALSGARDRDRDYGRSERCLRAPRMSMSSRTLQCLDMVQDFAGSTEVIIAVGS